MITDTIDQLAERLFEILSKPDFLAMKGLANEVPIFIQTYEPKERTRSGGWSMGSGHAAA
jgi:hypothetical protein